MSSSVLLTGVYYDPFITGEDSEAIQLLNISAGTISLAEWQVSDGEATVTFPSNAYLNPRQKIWLAGSASAFRQEFGFSPDYEYGGNDVDAVPDMSGPALNLTNAGDQVYLLDADESVVDALAYGNAAVSAPDWDGASVQPYDFGNVSDEGQILYRMLREEDGLPFEDTNSPADWAQDPGDTYFGKKIAYPGWDADQFFHTAKFLETATFKYCVAPDHLYRCVRREIASATATIEMEVYTLENAALVDEIVAALGRGVQVSILLDGNALVAQGKWACQKIEAHGGECWLMSSKPQANIHKRYDSQHGKWFIIDDARVLIGSENMGDDAMPSDDKRDGTFGARGGALVTDHPGLVQAARTILERDFDPLNHTDIRRWGTNTDDFPPFGFEPNYENGGRSYRVQFPRSFQATGAFPTELVQCPENCLRTTDALLGMVARAQRGDELLVEQLYEYLHWGARSSNPAADPNLRLEAYIAAAKRGARVRILLDSFFDEASNPISNYRTCLYVNRLSVRYSIECRLANPTGMGIHIKLVLLKKKTAGFVHLGSINGSETSNKLNRELAVQVKSAEAFEYWRRVFDHDWATSTESPHEYYLPFLQREFP